MGKYHEIWETDGMGASLLHLLFQNSDALIISKLRDIMELIKFNGTFDYRHPGMDFLPNLLIFQWSSFPSPDCRSIESIAQPYLSKDEKIELVGPASASDPRDWGPFLEIHGSPWPDRSFCYRRTEGRVLIKQKETPVWISSFPRENPWSGRGYEDS